MYGPNGALLKQERKKQRLSQAALGRAVGLSRTTISNWELGKNHDFMFQDFLRVAAHLGYEGPRFLLLLQDAEGRPPRVRIPQTAARSRPRAGVAG